MIEEKNYLDEDGNPPIVKEDDTGIRPSGKPDECFYCHSKVGEPHKYDCVTVVKRVKMRATIEYETEVPVHWDKEMIEFKYNDGCWCADHIVEELKSYVDYLNKIGGCLCGLCEIELIEDEDEDEDVKHHKAETEEQKAFDRLFFSVPYKGFE